MSINIKNKVKNSNGGNWIGVGTAIGAAVFTATNEPVWIAVGVAIGAALGWKKPKNKNKPQNKGQEEYQHKTEQQREDEQRWERERFHWEKFFQEQTGHHTQGDQQHHRRKTDHIPKHEPTSEEERRRLHLFANLKKYYDKLCTEPTLIITTVQKQFKK